MSGLGLGLLPWLPSPLLEVPWGSLGPTLKSTMAKVARLARMAAKATAALDPRKRNKEGTKVAKPISDHKPKGYLLTIGTDLTGLSYNFLS